MAHFTLSEEHAKQIADLLIQHGHLDFVFRRQGGTLLGVFMSKGRRYYRCAAESGGTPKVEVRSDRYMLGIRAPYGMMVATPDEVPECYLGANKKPPAEDLKAVCAFAKLVIGYAEAGTSRTAADIDLDLVITI